MRDLIKKALRLMPLPVRKLLTLIYESRNRSKSIRYEKKEYGTLPRVSGSRPVRNILIYHISALSFGGTEKNLQIIANQLCGEYNVFLMFSGDKGRAEFLDPRVRTIEFTNSGKDSKLPYFIHGMNPHIKNVIAEHGVDLIITADAGHAQYPFNTIKNIPIILINIFASPALQKNILHTIYISNEVRKKAEYYTGTRPGSVLYIPSQDPIDESEKLGNDLRQRLGIPSSSFVFGRIGRGSDDIFDPIALRAFKQVSQELPNAHYVIMSPMPAARRLVQDESIQNVHFVPSSSFEKDIWAFHSAIDCLAHFRLDGESCGLNIAESMLIGNPIITHRSHIWNAQTEYLKPDFARVADRDSHEQYATYMREFFRIKNNQPEDWQRMREASRTAGIENFGIEAYTAKIKSIIESV